MQIKKNLKRIWHFLWEDNSLLSWIAFLLLAIIFIKFVFYPVIGLIFKTSLPVVAVVSGSMQHNGLSFDNWWNQNSNWYVKNNISKQDFSNYIFINGFNKGDVIILKGSKPENIDIGNVIVYDGNYKAPIIHRVTNKFIENNKYYFIVKGDNNFDRDPLNVNEQQILGKAIFKIPYVGWVKVIFTDMINGIISIWR